MIPDPSRHVHLGYCSNIHPGETWPEVRANLDRFVPAVRDRVAPGARFGVGLRLSAAAAAALCDDAAFDDLAGLLDAHRLYVFTLNGFPYGRFHGAAVKEDVYRPDWLEPDRLAYTNRLADLAHRLAALAGETEISISTVPGGFKARAGGSDDGRRIAEALTRHVAHLAAIRRTTGCTVCLALEPEPCCLLETVDEVVAFFEAHLLSGAGIARLAEIAGIGATEAEDAFRRHLGVCLDACHMAVEFEDPGTCFAALADAGIAVAKIQLSAGIRVPAVDDAAISALTPFDDGVYLHQVVERRGDALRRFADLDAAIGDFRARAPEAVPAEWRIHFHVPVFLENLGAFASTRPVLERILDHQRSGRACPHLEVETYTWDVLPPAWRTGDVTEAIARELAWVLERLAS